MTELTDFEKRIYNCYLKNFRKGQPYRPRKDFSDINPNILVSIKKISYFLNKFPHIKPEEYFEAPNVIFNDDKYPPLNFFTGRTALKNYSLYQKQKENRNPEEQFEEIKKSYQFIALFCVGSKIELNKYLSYKVASIYCWINHYREHRINPYCLFEIGDIMYHLNSIPEDELNLFAQNLNDNIVAYRNRYSNSIKTQNYCKEIIKRISKFIIEELAKKN